MGSPVGLKISGVANVVRDTIATSMPNMTIRNKRVLKTIDWIGKEMSSPENRLILGATALMTQPFIDGRNKRVDEETRKVSVARTVAKILAGTFTGFLVRKGCILAIENFSKIPKEGEVLSKWRTFFTPAKALSGELKDLTHYKNALGTILSLGVMVFTNFMIDAPLTKYLTNKFTDKIHEKEQLKKAKENEKGGINE